MGRLSRVLEHAANQPHWFVYAICDKDGKPVYIGSTSNPERRYLQHRAGPQTRWQRPLRAWVSANQHQFEVLDTFPCKRDMLDAEREYIAYLRPAFNH